MFSNIDISFSTETGFVKRTDNAEWTIALYKYNGAVIAKTFSDYLSNIVRTGDLIIDNTDLTGVEITGQWVSSTTVPGYWGPDYIHDDNTGKGSKSVKYTPVIPASGDYEVLLRWTSGTNRASNVPVHIIFNGGVKDTLVNQKVQGAEWASAGIFNFSAGTAGSVTISNANTTEYVIADAVRFSPRSAQTTGIISSSTEIPVGYTLTAYPNPFNPQTKIKYSIPDLSSLRTTPPSSLRTTPPSSLRNAPPSSLRILGRDPVTTLKVFDILGREVTTLVNEYQSPGIYEVTWNASNFSSGVYYVRLETGSYNKTSKIVLVK